MSRKPIRRKKLGAIISIGDTHVNHKTAIMYPHQYFGDHTVRPTQHWLYRQYEKFCKLAKETIKDAKPDKTMLEMGGDMGDIDAKRRSRTEFWSNKPLTVALNTSELLRPLAELADIGLSIRGTGSHVGEDGTIDNMITKLVCDQGLKFDQMDDDTYIWPERTVNFLGTLIHFQHKGKNMSKGTRENMINALRRDIILGCVENQLEIPHVAVRHHNHWFGVTSLFEAPVVVQVAAWQLPYKYIYEIDPVGVPREIGAAILLVQAGKIVDIIPFRERVPREELKIK